MIKRDLIIGALLAAVWLAITLAASFAGGEMGAVSGYGPVAAWCVLLVVAIVIRPSWRAVGTFLGILAVVLIADAALSWNRIYHDPPSLYSLGIVELVGLFLAFWVTPFLVNALIQALRRRFAR
jgi:hypothetical protein